MRERLIQLLSRMSHCCLTDPYSVLSLTSWMLIELAATLVALYVDSSRAVQGSDSFSGGIVGFCFVFSLDLETEEHEEQ